MQVSLNRTQPKLICIQVSDTINMHHASFFTCRPHVALCTDPFRRFISNVHYIKNYFSGLLLFFLHPAASCSHRVQLVCNTRNGNAATVQRCKFSDATFSCAELMKTEVCVQ